MKNKSLTLSAFLVFASLFLISFASSTITLGSTSPSLLSQNSSSFTLNVSSDQNENLTLSASTITDYNSKTISFTSTTLIINNETKSVSIPYNIEDGFDFFGKTYTTTLTVSGNVSTALTKTLTFENLDFCSLDNTADLLFSNINSNDLKVSIDDIRVEKGLGSDGDWFPFDKVEIDVAISNKNRDNDVNNIVLEWGLFNQKTGTWFIEPTEEKEFDLNNRDDTLVTVSFTLNENDLNVNLEDLYNSDLVFYARATGDVDNDTEYTTCHSTKTGSNDIQMHIDRNFVIPTDLTVLDDAFCGSTVQISGKVWNIGTRDQKDVTMTIYNKELGINQNFVVGDIDSFSNKKFSATLDIPEDVQSKNYTLSLSVYDDNGDLFESSYESLESVSSLSLNVQGNCASTTPKASVSAKLQSDAVQGQDLLVKFVVSNLNSQKTTFNLELSGYQLWASSAELDQTSLTLDVGESAEVLATLKVDDSAEGTQNFNLLVKQGDKTLSQQVSVDINAKESAGFFNNVLSNLKQGNTYIWVIGLLNLVLIVLIIVIAVKLAKKK